MAKKSCVVGYYFKPSEILKAAKKVKDRQFDKWDTFTPFSVHGLDHAMGMERTKLPYVSFLAGFAGLGGGTFLTVYTHVYDWPMNIAGKPDLALPAYIPIMFELTILLAGLATAGAMFSLFLGLPNYFKPIFHPDLTNDRFAVAIEVDNEAEAESVKQFLQEIQAKEIHVVEGAL